MRRNEFCPKIAAPVVILLCMAFAPALAAGTAAPSAPPSPSTAPDDPAKVQAARTFIPLYHPQMNMQIYAEHLDKILPRMAESAKVRDPKADTKKYVEKMRAFYTQHQLKALDQQSHVVSRHFSLQELNELIAFFKGPAGKKLVDETPKIQQELAILNRPRPLKPGDIIDLPER